MMHRLENTSGRRAGMHSRDRLTVSQNGRAPTQQFTYDQLELRNDALGRFPVSNAYANVNQIKRYPDGTVDAIRLEPAVHVYLDLGGSGARDTAIGRV